MMYVKMIGVIGEGSQVTKQATVPMPRAVLRYVSESFNLFLHLLHVVKERA